MKLKGQTAINPITGQPEQAFRCSGCHRMFVGFQMTPNRTYCRKCATSNQRPRNAARRENTHNAIAARNRFYGRGV
jgi:hypothetical protein